MNDTINYESKVQIVDDERDLALDRLERMFNIYKTNRAEVPYNVQETMSSALITMINAITNFLQEDLDGGQSDS